MPEGAPTGAESPFGVIGSRASDVADGVEVNLEYADQFMVAMLPLCLTVMLHGMGMAVARRYYRRFGMPLLAHRHLMGRVGFMASFIAIMLATHFSEVAIWAALFMLLGVMPDIQNAMLFSMQSYTTMGINHALHGRWAGFSGFEAMTGMLMFGWTTAILASVVQKLHSVDE